MNMYHVDWLMKELDELESKKVITTKTSEKIKNHYNEKIRLEKEAEERAEAERKRNKKSVPVSMVLSIIASLLIVGGIITLIAYNYEAIPTAVKTMLAFVVMFATPAFYTVLKYGLKKDFNTVWTETISVFWSGLFGAGVAWLGQILRLPSNPAAFLLIWAIATVLVLYVLESKFAFGFAIFLSVYYCITGQLVMHENAVFTYLLIAALIPYAQKKDIRKYALILTALFLLGFVLEKSIPGLWIICYISAFVLLFVLGCRKENIYYKASGFIGVAVLLAMLTPDHFWQDIGPRFFRNEYAFNPVISIADYVVTAVLVSFAVYFVIGFIKKAKVELAYKDKSIEKDGFICKADWFFLATSVIAVTAFIYLWFIIVSFVPGFTQYTKDVFFLFEILMSLYLVTVCKSPVSLLSVLFVLYSGCFAEINFALPIAILFVMSFYLSKYLKEDFYEYKPTENQKKNVFISFPLIVIFIQNCVIYNKKTIALTTANHSGYILNASVFWILLAVCIMQAVFAFKKAISEKKDITGLIEYLSANVLSLFIILAKDIHYEFDFIPYMGMKNLMYFAGTVLLLFAVYSFAMKIIKNKQELFAAEILMIINQLAFFNSIVELSYLILFFALISWFGKDDGKNILAKLISKCGSIAFVFFVFIVMLSRGEFAYWNDLTFEWLEICYLVVLAAICFVIPLINSIRRKEIKPVVFGSYIILYLIYKLEANECFTFRLINGGEVISYISLAFIIVLSVMGMLKAYKNKKLASFNGYTVLMGISIIVEFFTLYENLVAAGVMFICFGIALFVINHFFMKNQSTEKVESDKNEEASDENK